MRWHARQIDLPFLWEGPQPALSAFIGINLRMFITLEGTEGSGKTSQIPALLGYLRQETADFRHPRAGRHSDQQCGAEILMGMENKAMHARTEILLFCASACSTGGRSDPAKTGSG